MFTFIKKIIHLRNSVDLVLSVQKKEFAPDGQKRLMLIGILAGGSLNSLKQLGYKISWDESTVSRLRGDFEKLIYETEKEIIEDESETTKNNHTFY